MRDGEASLAVSALFVQRGSRIPLINRSRPVHYRSPWQRQFSHLTNCSPDFGFFKNIPSKAFVTMSSTGQQCLRGRFQQLITVQVNCPSVLPRLPASNQLLPSALYLLASSVGNPLAAVGTRRGLRVVDSTGSPTDPRPGPSGGRPALCLAAAGFCFCP